MNRAAFTTRQWCAVSLLFFIPVSGSAQTAMTIWGALHLIQASELKGDLSFLASDALQGRYTPSPGLDVAAEFIASQFRAAGLEPAGDRDYFQTAAMIDRRVPTASAIKIEQGSRTWTVSGSDVRVLQANFAAAIEHAPAMVLTARDPQQIRGADLRGKAVIVPAEPRGQAGVRDRSALYRARRAFDNAVSSSGAALEILVGSPTGERPRARLLTLEQSEEHRTPLIITNDDELEKWMSRPTMDLAGSSVSLTIPAPQDDKVVLKNVVGILRGSDPRLKDTFVLLTAHYDHIGTAETGHDMSENRYEDANDRVYNGANDDGSGTVSVIEIAKALSRLHPKRSIVFMTFFGEERGDLGSQYYGMHPIAPLANTVADLNLEQVGRIDSTVGRQFHTASLTGFDYSEVPKYFEAAGRRLGVKVYMDHQASDAYFARSDNAALALQGVPAHTLCVAYDYPDYHGLGDEWQKVDYDNMAVIDRMVALGLWNLANTLSPPKWNAQNPKTSPYREAQARHSSH